MSAASVRLRVDGMTCLHCVGTVQKALEGVGGVRRAEVDLASGVARVDADADAPLSALVAAVEAVGFGAAAASPETATSAESCASSSGCHARFITPEPFDPCGDSVISPESSSESSP